MKTSITRTTAALALAVAGLAGSGLAAAQPAAPLIVTSWSLSGEFQNLTNPAGPGTALGALPSVWFYGYRVGSPLTTCPAYFTQSANTPVNYAGWTGPNVTQVGQNTATTASYFTNGSYANHLPARAVLLQPGYSGERALVEFRAPYSALFRISGQFYGLDKNPLTGTQGGTNTNPSIWKTDRAVARCGHSLVWAGSVRTPIPFPTPTQLPSGDQAIFSGALVMLRQGERLLFEVAPGPAIPLVTDGVTFGSTGLHAVVERAGPYCTGGTAAAPC